MNKELLFGATFLILLVGCQQIPESKTATFNNRSVIINYNDYSSNVTSIHAEDYGTYIKVDLNNDRSYSVVVYAICGDEMTCYSISGSGGLGYCVRSKELVEKYCNIW